MLHHALISFLGYIKWRWNKPFQQVDVSESDSEDGHQVLLCVVRWWCENATHHDWFTAVDYGLLETFSICEMLFLLVQPLTLTHVLHVHRFKSAQNWMFEQDGVPCNTRRGQEYKSTNVLFSKDVLFPRWFHCCVKHTRKITVKYFMTIIGSASNVKGVWCLYLWRRYLVCKILSNERHPLKLKRCRFTFSLGLCLCSSVLKPLVEVLSDPDSINRMLLSQLEQREQQAEQQKKAYTYAASYEDFIKLISTSADVNFLKQLRHDTSWRRASRYRP